MLTFWEGVHKPSEDRPCIRELVGKRVPNSNNSMLTGRGESASLNSFGRDTIEPGKIAVLNPLVVLTNIMTT